MSPHRIALLIASQCDAMPQLSFLPPLGWQVDGSMTERQRLVFDLDEILRDNDRGGWSPVPGLAQLNDLPAVPGTTLVINPTATQAATALKHAFGQAAADEAVLLVHYLGHGSKHEPKGKASRHYLQVVDSSEVPTSPDSGWDPYTPIEGLLERTLVPGFVLLVDACYAANALSQVKEWASPVGTGPYLWMAASQDTEAYDGCFTRTILDLIHDGVPEDDSGLAAELRAFQLEEPINQSCSHQNIGSTQNPAGAAQLYMAKNRAYLERINDLGLDPAAAALVQERRSWYQPNQAEAIVEWLSTLDGPKLGVVVGGPGSGKSTLAAVLRDRPSNLPVVKFDAVAFLGSGSTPDLIAPTLFDQLKKNPQYADAHRLAMDQPGVDPTTLAPTDKYLRYPLRHFPGLIRLVIDGFDQLSGGLGDDMTTFLTDLAAEHPHKLQVLVTSRHEVPSLSSKPIPELDEDTARTYLTARGVPENRHDALVELAAGSWIILNLAATHTITHPESTVLTPAAIFTDILGSASARRGTEAVTAVIAVLSATAQVAGPGPRLPFELFADATHRLGAPQGRAALYAVLSDEDLYRMIERTSPGTDDEHLGWFHAAVATAFPAIETRDGHVALIDAIEALPGTPKSQREESIE